MAHMDKHYLCVSVFVFIFINTIIRTLCLLECGLCFVVSVCDPAVDIRIYGNDSSFCMKEGEFIYQLKYKI
jgi:hypothetical protein